MALALLALVRIVSIPRRSDRLWRKYVRVPAFT